MIRNERRVTAVDAKADYEVEIGKTLFHVSHKFGDEELEKLITDYLSAKKPAGKKVKLAA